MWRINFEHLIVLKCKVTNGGTVYFFSLLDITLVNMYIIYLHCDYNINRSWAQQTPIIHLQFKQGFM